MPSSAPAAPAHDISDVGIGFVTPVLAENPNIARDPSRGGVGTVTLFDGSQWLEPQQIFLEARIMPPSLSGSSVALFWDVNPPSALDFNNLWIPPGATTLWPGNLGGDRAHSPRDTQARSVATSTVNDTLWDFLISGPLQRRRGPTLRVHATRLGDAAGRGDRHRQRHQAR